MNKEFICFIIQYFVNQITINIIIIEITNTIYITAPFIIKHRGDEITAFTRSGVVTVAKLTTQTSGIG